MVQKILFRACKNRKHRNKYTKYQVVFLSLNNLSLPNMTNKFSFEDGDFYITTEGYRCFTSQYHLKRGYCCDCDCKHCPYVNNKNSQNLTL